MYQTQPLRQSDSQYGRVITAILTLLLLLLALYKDAHKDLLFPKTGTPQFGQALSQLVSDMPATLFLFQDLE